MKEIVITLSITAPAACTEIELIEWVEYKTGVTNEMRLSNPLADYDIEKAVIINYKIFEK